MPTIDLNASFYAEPSETGFLSGKLYHIVRNTSGRLPVHTGRPLLHFGTRNSG